MAPAIPTIMAALVAATAATDVDKPEKESIAILSFGAQGVEPHIAGIVTQNATAAIDRLGVFRVISSDDIKSMLTAEALKQVTGCGDNSCLAEIAGAVGAKYLVSGSIGKLGDAYQISMTLIDQAKARTLDRVVRQDKVTPAQLPEIASKAARRVVRSLLEAKQGQLELVIDEPGADVVIDEVLVGVSPLPTAVKLPQGPHRLKIDKVGFITHKQDIEIRASDTVGVSVRLTPSTEFRESYKSTNGTLRMLAWLSTGVAALSLVGFAGSSLMNMQQQNQANQLLNDHQDVFGSDADNPQILDEKSPHVDTYRRLQTESLATAVIAYSSIGIGALAGISAAVFWILGEDPDRYDR